MLKKWFLISLSLLLNGKSIANGQEHQIQLDPNQMMMMMQPPEPTDCPANDPTCRKGMKLGIDIKVDDIPIPSENAKFPCETCYFPSNEWLGVPLLNIENEGRSDNSIRLTFALNPNATRTTGTDSTAPGVPPKSALGIPLASAVLVKGYNVFTKKTVVRPYNPIFERGGQFDLLIKLYPGGAMSDFISMGHVQVGDLVYMKQTKAQINNVIVNGLTGNDDYEEEIESITMIAGGTGITPMFNVLWTVMMNQFAPKDPKKPKTPMDTIKFRLLYANDSPQNILLEPELNTMNYMIAQRYSVFYILGEQPFDTRFVDGFLSGWIDERKLHALAYPAIHNTEEEEHEEEESSCSSGKRNIIWICGPDAMYNSLAGSRKGPVPIDSILGRMGFTNETIWRS